MSKENYDIPDLCSQEASVKPSIFNQDDNTNRDKGHAPKGPYQYPFPSKGDPWETCHRLTQEHDDGMCGAWKDEVQNLLIFAGLFSGVITAFTVESQRMLQPDPTETSSLILLQISAQLSTLNGQNSTFPNPLPSNNPFSAPMHAIRINICWFVSLILSLSTVLFGVLCLQWLREFQKHENMPYREAMAFRQMRYEALRSWKMPEILSALPLLLQAALVLFFTGLLEFLRPLHTGLTIVASIVVGLAFFFLFITSVLPALQNLRMAFLDDLFSPLSCPYKSAQSWIIHRFLFVVADTFYTLRRKLNISPDYIYPPGRFVALLGAGNWLEADGCIQNSRGTETEMALVWIADNLTRSMDGIMAICDCIRYLDMPRAWGAFWMIAGCFSGGLEVIPDDADKNMILEYSVAGILQELADGKDHSNGSLFLHRLEAFLRLTNSNGDIVNSRYGIPYRLTCPKFVSEGYSTNAIQVPIDMKESLLERLIPLIADGMANEGEYDSTWAIVTSLLKEKTNISELSSVLNNLFQAMDHALSQLIQDPYFPQNAAPSLRRMAMHSQLIYPIMHETVSEVMRGNLVWLTECESFLKYLDHLRQYDARAIVGDWEQFVVQYQLQGCITFTEQHPPTRIFEETRHHISMNVG